MNNPLICKCTKWKGLPANETIMLWEIDLSTGKCLIQRADAILEIHSLSDMELQSNVRISALRSSIVPPH